MIIRRVALFLIVLGTLACAAAYVALLARGSSVAWAPWALALGCAALPVGLFVLGAVRRNELSRTLQAVFGVVFLVLVACFGYALATPPMEGAGGPLLFGLPARTAVVLYGVGLIPLVILPIAYAWAFKSEILSDEDIERLRSSVAERTAAEPHGR